MVCQRQMFRITLKRRLKTTEESERERNEVANDVRVCMRLQSYIRGFVDFGACYNAIKITDNRTEGKQTTTTATVVRTKELLITLGGIPVCCVHDAANL